MTDFTVPDAQALLQTARSETGIALADPVAEQALPVLVEALNSGGRLHEAGAAGMTAYLARILKNRLRMERDLLANPEILEQEVRAPVFISGMARTGSTKLQKLLAASGDFNWLPLWKVLQPSLLTGKPDESPQPRIDETDAFARWFDAATPGNRAAHIMETHEPEEDSFIVEQSLTSPMFNAWAPVGSFALWTTKQDPVARFTYLRTTLQYLQWQGLGEPGKPWVLKSPLYAGMESAIQAAFPDCRFLMTHRHPRVAMPSTLRLLEGFHAPFTTATVEVGRVLAGQASASQQHMAFRARAFPDTFLDIGFTHFVKDWTGVVSMTYDRLGLPLSPGSLARMRAWDRANPQHKHGKFDYSLERYGLDEARIDAAFETYLPLLERIGE